jgi:hypothetical protein
MYLDLPSALGCPASEHNGSLSASRPDREEDTCRHGIHYMRRVLIGLGTPLGYYLASRKVYSACYSYKQALHGLPVCDEAVIIMPASRRLRGNGLGSLRCALAAASTKAAGRIVLLSSIDVYSSKGIPLDEGAKPGAAHGKSSLPLFESEILESQVPSQVLRLPDIFGPYITKGVASCLLHKDASKINRVAIHQLYPLFRLERDIMAAREAEAPIVNLVPEPVPMNEVLAKLFPGQTGHVVTPAPYSRIRTRYAGLFGRAGAYIMSAEEVLEEASRYVRAMRGLLPRMPKRSASAAAKAWAGALA